jgi:hypothetical protein
LLNFKATERSVRMTNPDGTLYCRVDWGAIRHASLDEETGV